ncbi:MAG: PAS domain-containing protein [Desulforhopalus sp.]
MNQKFVHRIAFRLVVWLVFFSSVLTICATAWQLYFDYNDDLERVVASVDAAALKQVAEVRRSVLAGDSRSVDSLLYDLVSTGGLAYAAVIVDEKIAWQQGEKIDGRHVCSIFPMAYIDSGNQHSCSLEVMADTTPVWQQLTNRFVQMAITNGIKIFLIAGFLFLMFQYLVTRHLESLAQQIRGLDFSKPYLPLTLERKGILQHDEFDHVVSGLNLMQQKAREAYDSLARNEQRLVLFFDSTEEAIIGVDRDGVCSFANDACLRILRLGKYESIIGKNLHELFVHSQDERFGKNIDECVVSRSMTEGRALQCEDGFLAAPEGRMLFVSLRSYPVFKEGEVSGAIVFMNDNSETRLLRRERELLSEAVKQVPLMIVIADSDNHIQYVNPGTEQLTGYSRQELIGRPLSQFNELSLDNGMQLADIELMMQNGKKWEGIVETHSKWGTPLKFFSVISPVFDDKNRVVNSISVSREVSYEIALQDELVNAKKMEAVGRLSASFAHEFGNPLFGVRSVLRDICDRIVFSEEDKQLLELACGECERMRDMVREFQRLYRDSASGDEVQCIDQIIGKVLSDMSFLMKSHRVESVLTLDDESCRIFANKNKLSLVLRNIVVNGIESMSVTGGKLEISTRFEGDYLIVSISDIGVGIGKEHQELIFEPFFSTKPAVEGAGLGLSIAYGTMKSIGGTITFVSEEGGGSSFSVHLPIR